VLVALTLLLVGCRAPVCTYGCLQPQWSGDEDEAVVEGVVSRFVGCWAFSAASDSLRFLPQREGVALSISPTLELTARPTPDVWPGLEGLVEPIAFRADSHRSLAAYWIPRPDGRGFIVKWKTEGMIGHVEVDFGPGDPPFVGSAWIPGPHIGLVLTPEITAERSADCAWTAGRTGGKRTGV